MFLLAKKGFGGFQSEYLKQEILPTWRLYHFGQVNCRDLRHARVTADRLGIGAQHNGLPARWHLNGTDTDAGGKHWVRCPKTHCLLKANTHRILFKALQADTHPVALGADLKGGAQKQVLLRLRPPRPLGAGQNPDDNRGLVVKTFQVLKTWKVCRAKLFELKFMLQGNSAHSSDDLESSDE